MRQLVKRSLLAAGHYSSRLAQHPFDGVAVLCFHAIADRGREMMPFAPLHVRSGTFEEQCRFLARDCSPVSLDQLEATTEGRPLPPNAVLVTFDDGYRSVLSEALPILERFSIPAVVFICTDPIERREHFWFDSVARRQGEAAVAAARQLPYAEWRVLASGQSEPADAGADHRPMTAEELNVLAAHPLIELGGHTRSHLTLANAPPDVQAAEITDSCRAVTAITGKPVRAFAYPYGKRGPDYDDQAVRALAAAGIGFGFTTTEGFAEAGRTPHEIPRFVMLDDIDGPELAHRLTYSWRAAAK